MIRTVLCSTGALTRHPDATDHKRILEHAPRLSSTVELAVYEAWYGHAKRHRAKADEARRRGRDHTARYHYVKSEQASSA